MKGFEKKLKKEGKHGGGMMGKLEDEYLGKMEAMEFGVKYDDGCDPGGILRGEIVLVGVWRRWKRGL